MGSTLSTRSLPLTVAAVVLSGAAFYLSEGLNPHWWAIWLAAVPLLWIVPRLPWTVASSAAVAAGLIGG